jgi:hypothetical protein
MNRLILLLLCGLGLSSPAIAGETIFGTWTLDAGRSTDLAIWKSLSPRLEITGTAAAVTLRTLWMEGKNVRWADSVTVRPGAAPTTVTATSAIWPDNWFMGVLTKKGSRQSCAAAWRTPESGLDLTTTRVVEVSQGDAVMTTVREMRLDSAGSTLTITERRSTRPTPVTLVFQRAPLP